MRQLHRVLAMAACVMAVSSPVARADEPRRLFARLFVHDAASAEADVTAAHGAAVEPVSLPSLQPPSTGSLIIPAALPHRITPRSAPPFAGVGTQHTTSQPQDPAPPAPPPREGTGVRGLITATASDLVALPRRRSSWVILAIGAGAAGLVHPVDDTLNRRLVGSDVVSGLFAPGKWVGNPFVQVGSAAGVWIAGRYILPRTSGLAPDNKVAHLGLDLLRAVAVSQAYTHAIKATARRDRPTGECCSFPSGHAATTFATASVLERHLGYRAALPTLLVAGYVAASRLHDDVHYASDVLFGAALGLASGWTVVGRHGRTNFAMVPVPLRGGAMVAFIRTPREAAERTAP